MQDKEARKKKSDMAIPGTYNLKLIYTVITKILLSTTKVCCASVLL